LISCGTCRLLLFYNGIKFTHGDNNALGELFLIVDASIEPLVHVPDLGLFQNRHNLFESGRCNLVVVLFLGTLSEDGTISRLAVQQFKSLFGILNSALLHIQVIDAENITSEVVGLETFGAAVLEDLLDSAETLLVRL